MAGPGATRKISFNEKKKGATLKDLEKKKHKEIFFIYINR